MLTLHGAVLHCSPICSPTQPLRRWRRHGRRWLLRLCSRTKRPEHRLLCTVGLLRMLIEFGAGDFNDATALSEHHQLHCTAHATRIRLANVVDRPSGDQLAFRQRRRGLSPDQPFEESQERVGDCLSRSHSHERQVIASALRRTVHVERKKARCSLAVHRDHRLAPGTGSITCPNLTNRRGGLQVGHRRLVDAGSNSVHQPLRRRGVPESLLVPRVSERIAQDLTDPDSSR